MTEKWGQMPCGARSNPNTAQGFLVLYKETFHHVSNLFFSIYSKRQLTALQKANSAQSRFYFGSLGSCSGNADCFFVL